MAAGHAAAQATAPELHRIPAGRPIRLLLAALLLALAAGRAAGAQPVLPAGLQIAINLDHSKQVSSPLAAVFADGSFVVAWTVLDTPGDTPGNDTTEIRARMFARSGAPLSDEISMLHPYDQAVAGLAVTPDGGFWMVWEQFNQLQRSIVMARRYDRHAKPMTDPFLVHAPSPFDRYLPALAAAPDGGAVVAWAARLDPIGFGPPNLMARFFAPDGTPRSPELTVALGSAVPAFLDLTQPTVGVEPDGSAWIVASSDTYLPGFGVLVQHVEQDGTVGASLDVCQDAPACAPIHPFRELVAPAMAMRQDGTFVVAWSTAQRDDLCIECAGAAPKADAVGVIQGRLFAADGTPLGTVVQLNALRTREVEPLLAALPDGRFVAAWADLDGISQNAAFYGRSFAATGAPDSRDFLIDRGNDYSLSLGAGPAAKAIAAIGKDSVQLFALQLEPR